MTTRPFSLERRLIGRLAPILGGSFLLFACIYLVAIQNDAVFHASEAVSELARSLGVTIRTTPDGKHAFDLHAVGKRADWPPGTAYAALDLDTGRFVDGSAQALMPALRDRPAAQRSASEVLDTPAGMNVLAMERVDRDGAQYRIAVLRPMTAANIATIGLRHEFAEEILPCFLPAFLLALVVTWITIRRHLRPLRRASAEASAVSVEHPGQRVSSEGLAIEIQPLIDAVNLALTRLEGALAAQRRFTANAAHELRTPLAVLGARVDGLQPGPERTALSRDIRRMTRSISQMLLTARLQAEGLHETAPFDLAILARDVVADIAPLAHASGRDIVLNVRERPILTGSAAAVDSAIRNLVENALRFTPPGDSVAVTVAPGPAVIVDDCGPGVADADKARIFEPFWRAESQLGDGAGLGLAIVSEVAAWHGGRITVEDRQGGGARFVLSLRGAPAGRDTRLARRSVSEAPPRPDVAVPATSAE